MSGGRLSRSEVAEVAKMVLEEMAQAITRGELVKLSSFGTFIVRYKGKRVGRNPKTGVKEPITPRREIVFKPSNILKLKIDRASR